MKYQVTYKIVRTDVIEAYNIKDAEHAAKELCSRFEPHAIMLSIEPFNQGDAHAVYPDPPPSAA